MTYILAIDPGLSSGIVLGKFSDTDPFERVAFWQVEGGLQGFLEWAESRWNWDSEDCTYYFTDPFFPESQLIVCAEKFTPLTNKGFSLTLDSVEPLRIEGALVALGLMPAEFPDTGHRWQRPAMQYWTSGDSVAEKRRKQKAYIKKVRPDWYVTGKSVGCKDAEDVWSGMFHALMHMRHLKHQPTLKMLWPEETE